MNILLIEDNTTITKGLTYALEQNDYILHSVSSIKEAKEYLSGNKKIDLIILDITLPDGSGFDLYKNIISTLSIPTIILTARDDEDDIVKGLDMGAEDYVTKPFSTKELLARINKILLRAKKNTIIEVDNIRFDIDKMVAYKDDKQIDFTSLEIKLLHLLFTNIGRVVTRSVMLDKVWEWTGNYIDDHTITVYLKRIREKLGTDIIVTIKGIGYRIDEK